MRTFVPKSSQEITDPVRLKVDTFLRRRRMHLHRRYLRALAAMQRTVERPQRPIFVIGCPRSGTTLLFRLLRRHDALGAPWGEGHVLWSTYQHPRDKGWSSDRATQDDIKPGEAHYVYASIGRIAGDHRFMDKTPRNCLKIPYLNALFPDARFILLKRDGRDTVSSLIEGWQWRHGVSYRLPDRLQLAEYQGHLWSYVLPPGWRDLIDSSIAEVAAHQYVSSYETAVDDLTGLPSDRVVELRFEDLVADPIATMTDLLEALDLSMSPPVMEMATDLDSHQVQTTSPPRKEKWRDRADQIERIMPLIAPTMERLGYLEAEVGVS
jgi:hypothetical protein